MERRTLPTEYTADGGKLVGYAAVFGSPTSITERGKTFTEVIRPGAFARALSSGGDIIATFNHDVSKLLGRTSAGTLRLNEDARGLRFELDLPDTQTGNEVRTLTARGDLRGASFTFAVRQGGEVWDGNTRTLTDLYLAELGPVVRPAYQSTSVGLRSMEPYRLRLELLGKL